LCEKYFLKKNSIVGNSLFSEKKNPKKRFGKKSPKIATTTYNMKGCLRIFHFHILNIVKFG
jgi:hypothetical protein